MLQHQLGLAITLGGVPDKVFEIFSQADLGSGVMQGAVTLMSHLVNENSS